MAKWQITLTVVLWQLSSSNSAAAADKGQLLDHRNLPDVTIEADVAAAVDTAQQDNRKLTIQF